MLFPHLKSTKPPSTASKLCLQPGRSLGFLPVVCYSRGSSDKFDHVRLATSQSDSAVLGIPGADCRFCHLSRWRDLKRGLKGQLQPIGPVNLGARDSFWHCACKVTHIYQVCLHLWAAQNLRLPGSTRGSARRRTESSCAGLLRGLVVANM